MRPWRPASSEPGGVLRLILQVDRGYGAGLMQQAERDELLRIATEAASAARNAR